MNDDDKATVVTDFPNGTRVRVVLEGVLMRNGAGGQSVAMGRIGHRSFVSVGSCSSIEPLPVVLEPGRWYKTLYPYYASGVWFCLPGQKLLFCHDGEWQGKARDPDGIEGPLFPCDPPTDLKPLGGALQ